MPTQEDEQFFYDHAGYSMPTNVPTYSSACLRCRYTRPGGATHVEHVRDDARRENAARLAQAEEIGQHRGWFVSTEYDNDSGADPDDDGETTRAIDDGEMERLLVVLRAEDGRWIASLGSVIIYAGDPDDYVRVVGAEMMAETLASHAECHARTTCGGCGHAWCGACDPAPAALCHWCHGRGYSTAELPPVYSAG